MWAYRPNNLAGKLQHTSHMIEINGCDSLMWKIEAQFLSQSCATLRGRAGRTVECLSSEQLLPRPYAMSGTTFYSTIVRYFSFVYPIWVTSHTPGADMRSAGCQSAPALHRRCLYSQECYQKPIPNRKRDIFTRLKPVIDKICFWSSHLLSVYWL